MSLTCPVASFRGILTSVSLNNVSAVFIYILYATKIKKEKLCYDSYNSPETLMYRAFSL
jgi:hypothetical protein